MHGKNSMLLTVDMYVTSYKTSIAYYQWTDVFLQLPFLFPAERRIEFHTVVLCFCKQNQRIYTIYFFLVTNENT